MIEEWKEIKGYEGKYFISNCGRLKNQYGLIMKPMKCTNGYLTACLWKNNCQQKILIHRLVAEAFINNPFGYSDVNHIDENKENNVFTNLEWCTHLYNMNYGKVREKIREKKKEQRVSLETRMKISMSSKNRRWMNKENTEVLIKEEEVPSFLLQGYKTGRIKNYV